jgi:hypothetical protein
MVGEQKVSGSVRPVGASAASFHYWIWQGGVELSTALVEKERNPSQVNGMINLPIFLFPCPVFCLDTDGYENTGRGAFRLLELYILCFANCALRCIINVPLTELLTECPTALLKSGQRHDT